MSTQEEAKQAVKKFNQSSTHLVTHMPGQFVHTYNRLNLSENDVIVVGYPKSGTQWLAQICHQIRTRGTDEDYAELTDEVPLIDIFGPLGGVDIAKEQKGDFKIFKFFLRLSYIPEFEQMPKEAEKCKFVIIFREPHNTFASFFDWDRYFSADMVPFASSMTMDDYYHERLSHPEGKYPVPWWNYVTSWLTKQNEKKILFVFYEHLLEDFEKQLKRISKFLEVSLSEEEKLKIKRLSSFEYMRENNEKFDMHSLRSNLHELAARSLGEISTESPAPVCISKGPNRDGQTELSDEVKEDMKEKWKNIIEPKVGFKSYQDMKRVLTG